MALAAHKDRSGQEHGLLYPAIAGLMSHLPGANSPPPPMTDARLPEATFPMPPRIASVPVVLHVLFGVVPAPERFSHPPATLANGSEDRLNWPPLTDASTPEAVLLAPPRIDSIPLLLHVFVGRVPLPARPSQPPAMLANGSEDKLNWPPLTDASPPEAVLLAPPLTAA